MWPQGWTPEDTARPARPRCGGERAALSLKVLPSRFLPRAHLLQVRVRSCLVGESPRGSQRERESGGHRWDFISRELGCGQN